MTYFVTCSSWEICDQWHATHMWLSSWDFRSRRVCGSRSDFLRTLSLWRKSVLIIFYGTHLFKHIRQWEDMFLFSYLWNATFISSSMALLSLRTPRQNWRLMSSRGRFDLTLFWDGFISILLESNDGGDRRDGDDFRMITSGVIDNAS